MIHLRRLISNIQQDTSKAPIIDHRSGVSLKMTICQMNASIISVVARTTETGPACSSWSARVNRIWPQNEKTDNITIRYHSNRVWGSEKPPIKVVIMVVSMMAIQPKLNMITAWCTPTSDKMFIFCFFSYLWAYHYKPLAFRMKINTADANIKELSAEMTP